MEELNKSSNFIGQYFRQYIKQVGFDRNKLIESLGWDYANNERMICAYFNKKDYLWEKYEVVDWCKALKIKETTPIHEKLFSKAGKGSYDCGK